MKVAVVGKGVTFDSGKPQIQNLQPFTLHPDPQPLTPHPSPLNLTLTPNIQPLTPYPQPRIPTLKTPNHKPEYTTHPGPHRHTPTTSTPNPQPHTLHPTPQTPHPQHHTRHPEHNAQTKKRENMNPKSYHFRLERGESKVNKMADFKESLNSTVSRL